MLTNQRMELMEFSVRQMEIVNAAIAIIANEGYEKLTTKKLATKMGFTEAALYKHISSKRELVLMILGYFDDVSRVVLSKVRALNLNPLESIRLFVLDRFRIFESNPALAKVMFSEELFKNDPSFTEQYLKMMHNHRDEISRYIILAQQQNMIKADYHPVQVFRIIMGATRLLVTQWTMNKGSFDLQSEGTDLIDTIIKLIEVER